MKPVYSQHESSQPDTDMAVRQPMNQCEASRQPQLCELFVPMVDTLAQEVFDAMRPRVSAEDFARLKDAFAFARKAHKGQRRKSKEPYICTMLSRIQL